MEVSARFPNIFGMLSPIAIFYPLAPGLGCPGGTLGPP